MNVLVIGGTGLVGSYLLPELLKAGHGVSAITRTTSKIDRIRDLGAHGILGDILRPQSFLAALHDRPEFIVMLAMPGIRPGQRINRKRKEALRTETNGIFRNSIELAMHYNAPIILPSGTSYQTGPGEMADETWPIRRTGLAAVGMDTDEMVSQAIRTRKPGVIQLIFGRIYGNGGLFRVQYDMLRRNRYKIIGKGENYIPLIHAADAADAIVKSIEQKPIGEKFIIADDTAVKQRDFANHMASLMGLGPPGNIPGPLIKLVLGRDLYELLTMNCTVTNQKAKNILGWKPAYPSYQVGLEQTIREMSDHPPYFSQAY
jgi:nucleoside-diphosphate-sugar epimerase